MEEDSRALWEGNKDGEVGMASSASSLFYSLSYHLKNDSEVFSLKKKGHFYMLQHG